MGGPAERNRLAASRLRSTDDDGKPAQGRSLIVSPLGDVAAGWI